MLQSKRATRWSGLLGGVGGVCVGLFTILVPYGTIAGAEVALSPLWRPAHSLHFVGGLLMLFGLMAMQSHQGKAAGGFGRFAFALALLGTAMFISVGMLTAFVWPALAKIDPKLVAADGPLFDTHAFSGLSLVLSAGGMSAGYLLYGWSIVRAQRLPTGAGWLLMLGSVLFLSPIPPMGTAPFLLFQAAGVVLGLGFSWACFAVWTGMGTTESDLR